MCARMPSPANFRAENGDWRDHDARIAPLNRLKRLENEFILAFHRSMYALASSTTGLLDYIVGLGKQQRWYIEAKGLCRLEIDDQFESRRLLDWQLGRLSPLQDIIDVDGCLPVSV